MTDVLTGWTFTRSIRNNAEKHIISALDAAVGCVPFPVLGMDFVGGSEFINHSVVRWAGDLDIYSRPLTPLQEERPGHHRVEEQPPGAPLRLLLPLRHQRGARGPGPSLGAGQRQAQLPARYLVGGPGWSGAGPAAVGMMSCPCLLMIRGAKVTRGSRALVTADKGNGPLCVRSNAYVGAGPVVHRLALPPCSQRRQERWISRT